MVDRYSAAIQAFWDKWVEAMESAAAKEQARLEGLSEARSGWLERTKNAEILRSGDPQAIKAQIEKYRKAMLTAKTGAEFYAAAGWVDRYTEQLRQLENLPQLDLTEINRQLGSLHSRGAYMGENAVGMQTEDFTRKTSETALVISDTLNEVYELLKLELELKPKDTGTTLE